MNNYTLSPEKTKQFEGIFIMFLINDGMEFNSVLDGYDVDLETILQGLFNNDFVEINGENVYVLTAKGQKIINQFLQKYEDNRKINRVFGYVDLQECSFAFSQYFDLDDDAWNNLLDETVDDGEEVVSRWSNLRIAVMQYKAEKKKVDIDPVEIVFMSAIEENWLDTEERGWQTKLVVGEFFKEILEVCNTAYSWRQLGTDEGGEDEARAIIEGVIEEGTKIMLDLIKQEEENEKAEQEEEECDDGDDDNGDGGNEVVTETVITEYVEEPMYYGYTDYVGFYEDPYYVDPFYYDPFYDPFYDPWGW